MISSTSIREQDGVLVGFVSKRLKDGGRERYEIEMPKYDAFFVGTGDLFSSIFLSWLAKTDFNIKRSMENTIATLQSVLKTTFEYAQGREGGLGKVANTELRLVQSRRHLENPKVEIEASRID